MSFHIFKYSFKTLLKDKMTVFWMLCFPLILATFFNFAFSNVLDDEKFEKIKIAIATDTALPEGLEAAIEDSEMFIISKVSETQAKTMLSEKEIRGYIKNTDGLELVVLDKGLNQSIIKVFLDSYQKINTTIFNILRESPEKVTEEFLQNIQGENMIKELPTSSNMNILVIMYFSLLAMACLLSANAGCYATAYTQANQTAVAARINVAPTKKLRAFLSRILATITFQFVSCIIAIVYITQVLKVDFGNRYLYIALTCAAGCFAGTMMGAMVGSLIKAKAEIKDMILTNVVLVMCFFSGLMVLNMKYIVSKNAPILSYVNPANLITDGMYALYYYDTFERFYLNIGLLTLLGAIFCTVTVLVLRRQKYASI